MDNTIQRKLKYGFTIARWGVDICLGALFIAAALIISALAKEKADLIGVLVIPLVMCIAGLAVFAVGRVIVGLGSRQLNLNMQRPLTEEERWFVACMMEMETEGAGTAFLNRAAATSGSTGAQIAAGASSMAVTGRFFRIGRRYMGHNFLINRLPAIISLIIAIVIAVIAIV